MAIKYWESMSAREKTEEERVKPNAAIRMDTISDPSALISAPQIEETVIKKSSGVQEARTAPVKTKNRKKDKARTKEKSRAKDKSSSKNMSRWLCFPAFLGITAMLIILMVLGIILMVAGVVVFGGGAVIVCQGISNLSLSCRVALELIGTGLCLAALGLLVLTPGMTFVFMSFPKTLGQYSRVYAATHEQKNPAGGLK